MCNTREARVREQHYTERNSYEHTDTAMNAHTRDDAHARARTTRVRVEPWFLT